MNYRYHKPHPLLAEYIRSVLVLEGSAPPDQDRLPLFTNGIPALFYRTEKDEAGKESIRLTLYGKSITPDSWGVNVDTTVIAYFFKPFVLPTLFNIPASKLMEAPMDLRQWSPHKAHALKTQLIYANSTAQVKEALDALLINQLEENRPACETIQYATDQILCNSGKEILSALKRKLNISERSFQRTFKKYVGITPSHYRRICQFHLSFSQLNSGKYETLTDVAYDNGFADQSHFIRSFREFTKTTPHSYLKTGLVEKNK